MLQLGVRLSRMCVVAQAIHQRYSCAVMDGGVLLWNTAFQEELAQNQLCSWLPPCNALLGPKCV
jgi:hypothetical protein